MKKRVQSAIEIKKILEDYRNQVDPKTLNSSLNEGLVIEQLEELQRLTIDLREDVSWLKKVQEKLLEVLPSRKEKIKILFLGANPTSSPLRLDEEVRKISSNIKISKERDVLVLKQEWAITVDSLLQAVLDEAPNFIHFSGHGNKSGIIIEDEIGNPKEITTEALVALFEVLKETVNCVLLNSCYSENQAKAIKEHIPYVIGMDSAIPDKTAIAFSSGFYQAIGAGKSVKDAFNFGKVKVKLENLNGVEIPKLIE